jgi:Na+/phosphate symporter
MELIVPMYIRFGELVYESYRLMNANLKLLHEYKWTCIAVMTGIALLASSYLFDVDLYETIDELLRELDYLEVDEILLVLLPVGLGVIVDMVRARNRRHRQVELANQHLDTLGQTLYTAQDIINNFLNSIQLYILKAQEQNLQDEDVERLDNLIQSTTNQLSQLEKPILDSRQTYQ